MPYCKSPPLDLRVDTARHLAVLHGASDDAIEATIALLPLGDRLELAAHKLIATGEHDGHSADFRLTDDGRAAIASCAEWLEHESDDAAAALYKSVEELAEHLGRAAERLASRVTSS